MSIPFVIVDEDEAFSRHLTEQLKLYSAFDYQGRYETAQELQQAIDEKQIELVFCNMNHTGFNSISFSVIAHENRPELMVVLYSQKPQDAYEALENYSFDFFVTPIKPISLSRIANRIREHHSLMNLRRNKRPENFMVRSKGGFQMIRLADVLYVERVNRRNQMVMVDHSTIELSGYTIGQLEKLLAGNGFFRCYKSIIVNMAQVVFVRNGNETKTYSLLIGKDLAELPLSREKFTEALQMLKQEFTGISL